MPQNESSRLAFDDVVIDLAGRRLWRGGIERPLEPKAFAVLALLATSPGRAFARDDILDAVWGHRHVTPGVLNRVVALLRQALGEDAQAPRYLHTVHGVGYRFDLAGASLPTPAGPPAPGAAAAADGAFGPAPASADSPAATGPDARRRTLSRLALLLAPLLAVLALSAWMLGARPAPAPAPAEPRSVAVLPFVDASSAADQQFFPDGLSDNLISTLSQFEGLRVLGRSASFRFRASGEDARSIGAKLGVSHLVEGSVQRIDGTVRIGIALVRSADGSVVWTRRFDRPYQDLFALQDDVALAVAGALQVKLLHAMPGAVESGRPASGNLDAYAAYLRGTHYMGGGRDALKAIEQFAEAARIDPGYAQAWSWLGFMRTQHALDSLDGDAARAAFEQARGDIDRALRLAPDFGQAHAIRANLLGVADHDWSGALAELRIALPLVPPNDPSHGAASRLLATLGKVNEAIDERRKYIAGDPLAAFARIYLADLLASLGRLDEAEASLRKAVEVDAECAAWCAGERSFLAILRGDAPTARLEAMREPPGRWRDRALAMALQIGPDRAAADAALRHLIDTDGQAKGDAYAIARVHALRGDAEQAFLWLRRDRERGNAGVHDVLWDPLLLRFRDDARFAEYCRLAGLPPPSASEALSLDRIRGVSPAQPPSG